MKRSVNDLISLQGAIALVSTTAYVNLPLALIMLSICGIVAAYVEECYKAVQSATDYEATVCETLVELEYSITTVNVLTFILVCCILYTHTEVPLIMGLVQSFIFGIYISRYWMQFKLEVYRTLRTISDREMFRQLDVALAKL